MPWAALEPLKLSDREELIAKWAKQWDRGEAFMFGVFRDEVLVGGCGLYKRVGAHGLDIGYWTRASATRQGVATDAAGCLVRAAFSMRGIEFVEARHDVASLASRRVPERLGFTFVGERAATVGAPAETGTDWVWRLDRADWKQTQES